MRNWLNRLLYGRYGFDNFSKFLMIVWFALAALNIFIRHIGVYALSMIPAVLIFLRMFSRNIAKRSAENAAYNRIMRKAGSRFKFHFLKLREIKTHRYRKCPACRAVLRLPRRPGKHTTVCPKCKNRFDVKIIL